MAANIAQMPLASSSEMPSIWRANSNSVHLSDSAWLSGDCKEEKDKSLFQQGTQSVDGGW